MKFILSVYVFLAAAIAGMILAGPANAQFREQRAWQFEDPVTKAIRLQRAQSRQLYRGGFFEGSHASRYISIGTVEVDDVNGSVTLTDQSSTNIGTYQSISQEGSGTLNVDSEASSGEQSNTNTSEITRQDSPNSVCLNCGS